MRLAFPSRRQALAGLALGAGLPPRLAVAADGQAPPRRLRLLCIAPPGGTPDLVARVLADRLGRHFSEGVIVENRPGAGGIVAALALRQAAPDGGTLLLGHGGLLVVNPHLHPRLPYDAGRDLLPVAAVAEIGFGLAVGPAVPPEIGTLTDFLDWARRHPQACQFGSPGLGTLAHLVGAMLFAQAGIASVHIAFGSGPQAIGEVMAGRLAAVVLPDGLLRPHLAGGRVRVLATAGEARSAFLPQVPTLSEQGWPGVVAVEWLGCFAPPGTPEAVRATLGGWLHAAARDEALRRALDEQAVTPVTAPPALLPQRVARESQHWHGRIKALGVRIE